MRRENSETLLRASVLYTMYCEGCHRCQLLCYVLSTMVSYHGFLYSRHLNTHAVKSLIALCFLFFLFFFMQLLHTPASSTTAYLLCRATLYHLQLHFNFVNLSSDYQTAELWLLSRHQVFISRVTSSVSLNELESSTRAPAQPNPRPETRDQTDIDHYAAKRQAVRGFV